MRTITVLFQIIFFTALVYVSSSCVGKREVVTENNTEDIRYGKNGVPNYIKGNNLSAALDTEEAFQVLKSQKKYGQMALYYLERQHSLFRLTSAKQEFVVDTIEFDAVGQTHTRLKQVFHQIPVWDTALGIHFNSNDQIYYVHGTYQPISSGLSTQGGISKEAAAKFALKAKQNDPSWRVESIEKVIYAPSNDIQHLSYKANLVQNGLHREYCFVDAVNGHVIHCVSRTTNSVGLPNKSY